jgi:hypothetical protein
VEEKLIVVEGGWSSREERRWDGDTGSVVGYMYRPAKPDMSWKIF